MDPGKLVKERPLPVAMETRKFAPPKRQRGPTYENADADPEVLNLGLKLLNQKIQQTNPMPSSFRQRTKEALTGDAPEGRLIFVTNSALKISYNEAFRCTIHRSSNLSYHSYCYFVLTRQKR